MDTIRKEISMAPRNDAAVAELAAGSGEYLTFRLGAEEYCVEILKVQEIRSYEAPTRIASAARCNKGVINLRGVIVPIVDLRIALDCDAVQYNDFTVVIVLNVGGRVIGAVVDSVSDVLKLSDDMLRPAPQITSVLATSFMKGIATVQQRMLILMDIEALVGSASMGLVHAGTTH